MPEQLIIGFNPMSAANRVAYFGSQIRGRLMWLVLAVVVCFGIWIWQRASLSPRDTGLMFGVGIAYSLIWLAFAFVNWLRAKSALSAVSPGVAATVDRQGIWLQGVAIAWPQVARITIRPGRFGGTSSLLVKRADGAPPVKMSLALLDAMPGTIDSAIRAYSGGAQQIDTSKLGN